jgi:hypothetical protein
MIKRVSVVAVALVGVFCLGTSSASALDTVQVPGGIAVCENRCVVSQRNSKGEATVVRDSNGGEVKVMKRPRILTIEDLAI